MPAFRGQGKATEGVVPAAITAPIRVAIVDDHNVVRAGMERLFLSHSGFMVVGTAGTARDALAIGKAHKPDVMVLDIVLGQESAMDVLELLAASVPQTAAVIYSGYPDRKSVV